MRKTIARKNLVLKANDLLKDSPDGDEGYRAGVIALLESVLLESKAYNGFNYLTPDCMLESKFGTTVGVNGQEVSGKWNFDNTDHTRVYYY